jgi:hypothetical protein
MLCTMLLTIVLAAATDALDDTHSSPSAGEMTVKLLDAYTTEPIANSDVHVVSDNGIRCRAAPCPTETVTWSGRSDARGYVAIPRVLVNVNTSVATPFHNGELTDETPQDDDGDRVVELLPTSLDSGGPLDLGLKPIKLVDRRSGKALASLRVRIDFRATDSLQLTTNALGYVFVPGEKVLQALEGATVNAPGYRSRKLDFGGVHVVTPLERAGK